MSRARRLLALLQELRCHRYPVRGAALADTLGVSLRTVYRDVAALQGQGVRIDGAPGLGYMLRPGAALLPPLAFTEEEVEALALGARWVTERADAPLADAARHALAKIRAVLNAERRAALDDVALLVPPRDVRPRRRAPSDGAPPEDARREDTAPAVALGASQPPADLLAAARHAIRAGRKVTLAYRDPRGRESVRTVWPVALAYFDRARVLVAWCELRGAFRHFRADRIEALTTLDARYPRPRHALVREWREAEGVPARVTGGP